MSPDVMTTSLLVSELEIAANLVDCGITLPSSAEVIREAAQRLRETPEYLAEPKATDAPWSITS